jgi:hypothetical protein
MSFLKENKLLLSLLMAVFTLGIAVLLLVSAEMTISQAKSAVDSKYYDIPKAPSPNVNVIAKNQDGSSQSSSLGFVDPIVRERAKKERGGTLSGSDILNFTGSSMGFGDEALPEALRNKLNDKPVKVISPFDDIYNPDSPWKFWGPPGRQGQERYNRVMKYKEELKKGEIESVDPSDSKGPDPSVIPFGSKKPGEVNLETMRRAFAKLFLAVITSRKEAEQKKNLEATEGKLENSQPGDSKKENSKKGK